MKFIDRAKLYLKAGDGGNGCISFRRERCVPEGGPDGGDGGKGGDIIFVADSKKSTLIDFFNCVHYKAENGVSGKGSNCFGRHGKDIVLHVPLGTQIWNEDQTIMYFDAVEENSHFTLFQGGKGGVGNARFVSSTNQTPTQATKGQKGEEGWFWLVLKLFADIGYVGFPNAGKSSLLHLLTGSKTKVANYAFTTTFPELGAMFGDEYHEKKLVMADLPGIIQGAHKNKGLGLQFLGHIERCYGILHIIDIANLNADQFLSAMLYEIGQFNPELLEKKQIIALNKIDLVDQETLDIEVKKLEAQGFAVYPISCHEKTGIDNLVNALFALKYS